MDETLDGNSEPGGQSDDNYQFERLHIEPIYDAFICPLTKQVMRDPVTLENGQTFEREAIEKWFKECREDRRRLVCPVTLRELRSTELNPSIALKNTIGQWNARNEAAKLDMARRSLSINSPENEIIQALRFVQHLCAKNRSNKHTIRNAELLPMIVDVLRSSSRPVRCKALETLRIVVEDDADNKEIMAEGDTVRTIVKFLSHEQSKEREKAVSLLFELSMSERLCEKIGSVNGAILILVGMASSKSENVVAVEKADRTLENLSKCENNVRQMAKCGRLQPLLMCLLEGSPETKLSMASFLGEEELALNNDVKVFVAKTAGASLISLVKSSHPQSREAALKALNQISSDETSAKILIEAGILPPLVRVLFTVGNRHLPTRLKEVSATILSNIVNSGNNFDSVPVGPGHQTLVSEETIHNLLQLISNTGPSIECKLLQVLVGLTGPGPTVSSVVSAIQSSGAIASLVQFVEAQQPNLQLASIKLLQNLSPHMGQELAGSLRAHVGSLVHVITQGVGITEDQAAAVGLLASLPEHDVGLTRVLLDVGAFPLFASRIVSIRQGEMRGSRFMTPYLDGLVKVLSRITFALSEDSGRARGFCREHSLASLFIELLQANGLDNVQMSSAVALRNLSQESKNLTKRPESPPPGLCFFILPCLSKPTVVTGLCKVHGGTCSLKETFCLLEGQAVDKLVAVLDHRNDGVVEASLAALSTLLDDGVDFKEGIVVLLGAEGVKPMLDLLLENRVDGVRARAVWAAERLLRNEDIAIEVADNPQISTALVDAFRHGDYGTRQIAERALKHVDKIPNFSGIFPNQG